MWLSSIITSSATAFGRLLIVNLLPAGILVIFSALMLRADAFSPATGGLSPTDLVADFKADAGLALLLVVLTLVVAVLLQPFEIPAVQLIEGYWSDAPPWEGLARWRRQRHIAVKRRLLRDVRLADGDRLKDDFPDDVLMALSLPEQAARRRDKEQRIRLGARSDKRRFQYPGEDEVMPTLLGNVLKTAESLAGQRYNFDTDVCMPRLYPHLSPTLAAAYKSTLDAIDAAAMMTLMMVAMFPLSLVAFVDDPAMYWLPPLLLVAAYGFYRGAIVEAGKYTEIIKVAFDLHRFDMVKSLRLDLPKDTTREAELGAKVSSFWKARRLPSAKRRWASTTYRHYEDESKPGSTSHHNQGSETT